MVIIGKQNGTNLQTIRERKLKIFTRENMDKNGKKNGTNILKKLKIVEWEFIIMD